MKRKAFTAVVLVFVLFLLVSGCAMREVSDSWSGRDDMDMAEPAPDPAYRDSNDLRGSVPPEGEKGGDFGQRYAILTGEVNVNVEDMRESVQTLRQFVESKGGFIAGSTFYSDPRGESQTSYLTLRVPQQQFDATMAFLEEDLGKRTHSKTDYDDVTLQYVDMEARINNLARQEARYTEILNDAKTVEEILQIERELVRIRGDIESLTAQFIHLKDRVSLATISVALRQTVLATPGVTAVGFEGAWNRALVALTESMNLIINGTADFFVLSFRMLPFIILALFVIFVIYRILKRMDRRSTTG